MSVEKRLERRKEEERKGKERKKGEKKATRLVDGCHAQVEITQARCAYKIGVRNEFQKRSYHGLIVD